MRKLKVWVGIILGATCTLGCTEGDKFPRTPEQCPSGCSVALTLKKGPNCTSGFSEGRIRGGLVEFIDRGGTVRNSEGLGTNSKTLTVDCGYILLADLIIVEEDETCPGGKRVYVGRADVTPYDKCNVEHTVCLKSKFCM